MKIDVEKLIESYIKFKTNSWTKATRKSEHSRLWAVRRFITGDPCDLWQELSHYKPYTRQTAWTRVCKFWDFLIMEGEIDSFSNPYKQFREQNQNFFKNTYDRKPVPYSYQEIINKIADIKDESIRNKATQLLVSGMRFSESMTLKDGTVMGKGQKRRKVFVPELSGPIFDGSYDVFYAALKKVGLTAHMLRKVAATRLVEKGAKEADLLAIMGWSKIETAKYYLQPKTEEELEQLVFS